MLMILTLILTSLTETSTMSELQLKLTSGPVARDYSPVRVVVPREMLKDVAPNGPWFLESDHGVREAQVLSMPGSAQVEIVWIETALPANASRQYTLRSSKTIHPTRFRFAEGPGYRSLLHGDRPIYRHEIRFDPADLETTKKTYQHLFGMNGEGFITKGAGGQHPHHRGVFAGWTTKVGDQASNFWVCNNGATIRHREAPADARSAGPVVARDVSLEDWVDAQGETVVRERRVTETWRPESGQRLLDFSLTLEAAGGQPVLLTGDPHHGGFQVRAVQSIAEGGGSAKYLRPTSAAGGKNDIWSDCPWVAMDIEVRGHGYRILHLDHAQNPRPMVYSTRPYGRFGSYFETTLEPGRPVVLQYRLLLVDHATGPRLEAAQLEARHRDYQDPVTVEILGSR